ncbi:MAG: U32 family peptidase [Candidatus Binatia bacterium]
MILSVPTIWDKDYLLRLKDYPQVGWLYGSLPTEIVGSGRQAALLPAVNRESAAEHIRQAHRLGLKFNYLLNTSCLGNREYTGNFHRLMLKYIEWVAEQNPDMVTVTLPFLAQIIKNQFPSLKISVSKYANVDSLQKAKFWEELGADEITIPDDSLNRDFKMLRLMRENLRCGIQVFTNLACLSGCPFAQHHANLTSHGAQRHEEAGGVYLEYCLAKCKNIRVRRPVEIIKSGWIRPEDLHHYEELGITKFKLVDRSLTSSGLLKRVKAYSERKYAGNLADIICLHTRRREHRFAAANLEAKEPGIREKLRLMGDAIFAAERITIDNQKLDGFLDGIKKIDCRYVSCDHCGYCERYAQKAVAFCVSDQEEAIRRSDLFLQKMTSSEIFE